MAINKTIRYLPVTIALLFVSIFMLTQSTTPPAEGCTDEVIAFSPCLPYISAPPNNQSESPSSQCCDLFASAFDSGNANCLCYLVREPYLLGFPLNSTRLLSLSSLCPPKETGSNGKHTLESFCSGPPGNLPPLHSSPSRRRPPWHTRPAANPGPDLPPKRPPSNPPTHPEWPVAPVPRSCASKQSISGILRLQLGTVMLFFLFYPWVRLSNCFPCQNQDSV